MKKKVMVFFFVVQVLLMYGSYNKYPLDSQYHTPKEVGDLLKKWAIDYKEVFYLETIGYSSNDKLPIKAFKIGFNPTSTQWSKPSILIIGQIHSEEVIGQEICLGFAQDLLLNYKTNKKIQILLNSYNIWFIPTINPEGNSIVSNGKFFFHRKNKTDTNNNKRFDPGIDGVDLNRNFPFN